MDGFASARLKLARAATLLADVERAVQHWDQTTSWHVTSAVEPAGDGTFDIVVRVAGLQPIPDAVHLHVDEALHHWRSALDHVVWQSIEDNGGHQTRQMFPVLDKRNDTELRKKLAGVGPAAITVIDRFQPYRVQPHTDSHTRWLHQLDIVAKHRSVVGLGTFNEGVLIRAWPELGGGQLTFTPSAEIEDGESVVVRIRDVGATHVVPEGRLSVTPPVISIVEGADFEGRPLIDVLHDLEVCATTIVDELDAVRPR